MRGVLEEGDRDWTKEERMTKLWTTQWVGEGRES